ncbi:thioredoxin family protein [uncultured Trichococcus sp.]|uniref:thioredoxin family protein n=1 Tax=uncultured Trichococcus sp. TaxID=189665 RepID=UPI002A189089|nr:thioredoxin family protein [uncultured Trichococcus sp.]
MKKYLKWLLPLAAVLVLFVLTTASGARYQAVDGPGEYADVMDEEIAYLYFGRDTCKYCRAFEPLLEESISETDAVVYHYDTDEHSEDENFQDILDAHEVVTVPKLVKLEKGEVVDYVDHTDSQDAITALLAEGN